MYNKDTFFASALSKILLGKSQEAFIYICIIENARDRTLIPIPMAWF